MLARARPWIRHDIPSARRSKEQAHACLTFFNVVNIDPAIDITAANRQAHSCVGVPGRHCGHNQLQAASLAAWYSSSSSLSCFMLGTAFGLARANKLKVARHHMHARCAVLQRTSSEPASPCSTPGTRLDGARRCAHVLTFIAALAAARAACLFEFSGLHWGCRKPPGSKPEATARAGTRSACWPSWAGAGYGLLLCCLALSLVCASSKVGVGGSKK